MYKKSDKSFIECAYSVMQVIGMKIPAKDAIKNRLTKPLRRLREDSEGVVLAAVLIFISLLLPVTLIILNSVEIETMLPTNEGFGKIASHEADKGFDMAMSALLADNEDGIFGDSIVDPTRPVPANFPRMVGQNDTYWVMGMARGRHDIDYLAEPWARHPENYTYLLSEHSRENTEHADWNPDPDYDPDEYSIPTRWVMMNVPFGMDDHGELTVGGNGYPDIYTNMEQRPGEDKVTPVNAYAADTTEPDNEWQSPPIYVHEFWWESPSHPDFVPPKYIARPASYLRNTNPGYAASQTFYDAEIPDAIVYDSMHDDMDGDGVPDVPFQNQYLPNPELQEAVSDSTWSNVHFGAGNQPLRNKEYKPLPGTVTQYPVGSTGEDFIPAWFESICSDESSRINLNTILNIVYQGGNYDYNNTNTGLENPQIRYDDWGASFGDYELVMRNNNHPNYSNHLLALDMITSLLLEDEDLRQQSQAARLGAYNEANQKAKWILQNMLIVRERLDANYDADSDGLPDEIDLTYPDPNMTTVQNAILNGRGRMGDGVHPWLGTWQVYRNPKDFLNDPGLIGRSNVRNGFLPINDVDFKILHGSSTVYSYETEHLADIENTGMFDDDGYRLNFNELDENDFLMRTLLNGLIGKERLASLFRWRDGLVDLNGDGDLNDEYVLQPVKDPGTAEDDTNVRPSDGKAQPVSEITYRERNHFNFQDPKDPKYPNMLNIPDLGSMLLVPMSIRETQIIACSIDTGTNAVSLNKYNPNPPVPGPGALIPDTDSGDDPYATDIDFSGTQVIFDEISTPLEEFGTVDVPRGLNYVFPAVSAEGFHPSLNPDATQFVYVDKDTTDPSGVTISTWNIIQDARTNTDLNQGIQLAQMINMPSSLDDEFFEAASPDWSPNGGLIAFAGGGVFDVGDPTALLAGHTDIYIVRMTGSIIGIPDNITNLRAGQYAFYPDFSPDGEWLAYTVLDISEFIRYRNGETTLRPFKIRLQNLVNNQIQNIPRSGGSDLIDPYDNSLLLGVTLMPFAPDWDPRGNYLCFMGLRLGGSLTDIYKVSRGASNLDNITNTPAIAEMFPCWGWGQTVVSSNSQRDDGDGTGRAVAYPPAGINPDADPWDDAKRQELAQVLQNASLALRLSNDSGYDQNWRYMDMPVVPDHMIMVAQELADILCFRQPYYENPNDPAHRKYPYAYPGKININTAPRKVLRSLFLLMFQGSVVDWTADGTGYHGCAPIADDVYGSDTAQINLCYDGLGNDDRLLAIQIADAYAHQVDEYRRWVYNNQSKAFDTLNNSPPYGSHTFSITPETVADDLIMPEGTGLSFRVNPFSPYDTDNSPFTQERYVYDPEPPFRSIADLFNVALYPEYTDDDWLIEGYISAYGPDEEEEVSDSSGTQHVVPMAYDNDDPYDEASNFGDTYSGPNALAVWGPIYQMNFEITKGLPVGDGYKLDPWDSGDSNVAKDPASRYYKQQRFRLFSADDFKWIAPYITVRSYTYRVESRGTVRVANGTNKLDITRDKYWIVDFGQNAYLNFNTTGWETDPIEPINARQPINGNTNQPYVVRAFEEVPVDGISLTRRYFSPPPMM